VEQKDKLIVFEDKNIRRAWFNDEWWYVIKDVIGSLTESKNPADYLKKLRKRDESLNESFKGGGQIVPPLGFEFETKGGNQLLQCWNTSGIFRLIQSIPSKKTIPFKEWLAQVGYERVLEIENPELAQDRVKEYYELKGYPKDWVDKRLRGISIRQELTDEWKKRGVSEGRDFAILTSEISKATFGMTPNEYKIHKNIPKESKVNLRDHMDDFELIFSMLGERVTKELSEQEKPETFEENVIIASKGGNAAGDARKATEKQLRRSVISEKNYLEKEKMGKLE
jgi:hypothetical protein